MQFSYGLKTGLKAALTLIILSWLSFYATKSLSPVVAQIGSIVAIMLSSVWMIDAIRFSRDVTGKGKISFWGAFFSAMQVGLLQAAGMFFSTLVFLLVSTGQFRKWSSLDLELGMEPVVMRPVEQGVIMFLIVLVVSSIMALIFSITTSNR